MATPATTGQLQTAIKNMKVGDYILCNYSRTGGNIFTINSTTGGEMPYTGTTNGSACYFYFVKVAKGLLIGDRVINNNVTWDSLHSGQFIQGKTQTLDSIVGILRSPSGGNYYANANGKKSATTLSYGAFPTINEWDSYITRFPTLLTQSGKTTDDIFHWSVIGTWCQDTPITGLVTGASSANNTSRTVRGIYSANQTNEKDIGFGTANTAYTAVGYRPVFEYVE